MHAALVANADKTSEPFRLFVNDEDILGNAPSGGVPLESLEWEYAGSNSPATMSFEHWDPPRAFSISGRARVRFWSLADDDLFQGNLVGRESDPAFATGRTVGMRATDASVAALDRNIVTRCSFPAGLTDKDIIQGLCGQFARGSDFTWLDAEGATEYIGITNVAMPAMAFQPQSLRSAIDVVAVTANNDESLQRVAYIDENRRLIYRQQFDGGAAPFVVVDGTPAGGQKACENLKLVDDDSGVVTAVYVNGKNSAGTGWVVSHGQVARYGWSAEVLDAPDSDTTGKRDVLGQSYLVMRRQPVRRGTFDITGTTGWKADQVVTINSTALGLSSATFLIRHVKVKPLTGVPTLRHMIEFGARRPSSIRLGGNIPDATGPMRGRH